VSAPYWLQDRRKPETLARERAHLAALRWLEKLAIKCGLNIRPKVGK
jgi:hypothetical protein